MEIRVCSGVAPEDYLRLQRSADLASTNEQILENRDDEIGYKTAAGLDERSSVVVETLLF